jgi:hypothetical protein
MGIGELDTGDIVHSDVPCDQSIRPNNEPCSSSYLGEGVRWSKGNVVTSFNVIARPAIGDQRERLKLLRSGQFEYLVDRHDGIRRSAQSTRAER